MPSLLWPTPRLSATTLLTHTPLPSIPLSSSKISEKIRVLKASLLQLCRDHHPHVFLPGQENAKRAFSEGMVIGKQSYSEVLNGAVHPECKSYVAQPGLALRAQGELSASEVMHSNCLLNQPLSAKVQTLLPKAP